jgi:hypothetical protein
MPCCNGSQAAAFQRLIATYYSCDALIAATVQSFQRVKLRMCSCECDLRPPLELLPVPGDLVAEMKRDLETVTTDRTKVARRNS